MNTDEPKPDNNDFVVISRKCLECLIEMADSFNDDLSSGLDEGLYQDGNPEANALIINEASIALKTDERIITTEFFWDCECKEDYIHAKTPGGSLDDHCDECGANSEEQPDSRLNEVINMLMKETQ